MDVADDSEIDWNLLPDPDWNLWSAHSLQRRWLTMKRGVTDYENMPFAGSYVLPMLKGLPLTTLQSFWTSLRRRKAVLSQVR